MRNAYEVLQQKETDLVRVRHEIESLRIVASLLSDELPSEELTKNRARSADETLDPRFRTGDRNGRSVFLDKPTSASKILGHT
jgi:hypothetical protein